jgi:hypothetical protein
MQSAIGREQYRPVVPIICVLTLPGLLGMSRSPGSFHLWDEYNDKTQTWNVDINVVTPQTFDV